MEKVSKTETQPIIPKHLGEEMKSHDMGNTKHNLFWKGGGLLID